MKEIECVFCNTTHRVDDDEEIDEPTCRNVLDNPCKAELETIENIEEQHPPANKPVGANTSDSESTEEITIPFVDEDEETPENAPESPQGVINVEVLKEYLDDWEIEGGRVVDATSGEKTKLNCPHCNREVEVQLYPQGGELVPQTIRKRREYFS